MLHIRWKQMHLILRCSCLKLFAHSRRKSVKYIRPFSYKKINNSKIQICPLSFIKKKKFVSSKLDFYVVEFFQQSFLLKILKMFYFVVKATAAWMLCGRCFVPNSICPVFEPKVRKLKPSNSFSHLLFFWIFRRWAKSTLVLLPLFGVHYTVFLWMYYSVGVDEKVELVWLFCDQTFASFQV